MLVVGLVLVAVVGTAAAPFKPVLEADQRAADHQEQHSAHDDEEERRRSHREEREE